MKTYILAATILTAMLATESFAHDPDAKPDHDKCYGVSKTGKNDCGAKDGSHSCAGLAKKDNDPNEWISTPKGLCDKLTGGQKD